MEKKDMIILGIETSCDETSVALVRNGTTILSLEIASSVPLHQKTRGVVPEVAAREQLSYMIPVLDTALKNAQVAWEDIDKIAVTQGPGLRGSLLVGIATANTLSLTKNIPLVGVPHIWGHIYANMLQRDPEAIQFPVLVLTVSGGHNDIYLWKGHGNIEKLGGTLDDTAGEAFDKCGRLLGLPYPAGPHISKLAESGNKNAYELPLSMVHSGDLRFSFSGLKTAFLYTVQNIEKEKGELTPQIKADLAASLQYTIVTILQKKVMEALKKYQVKEIHLSGGVSANTLLRKTFASTFSTYTVRAPEKILYSTDNAAMIASCAYFCPFKEGIVDITI